MGFYSVFGSVLGMASSVWVAIITHRVVTGRAAHSAKVGVLTSVGLVMGCALFCAMPFYGIGSFAYAGEGFCYFDWYDPALASLLMVVVLACMAATLTLLGVAVRRGGWPSKLDLYLMIASLLSAWSLWVPACIVGLAHGSFPSKYMLVGGVMGHAQALINPYVYGLRWRRSVLTLRGSAKGVLVDANLRLSLSMGSSAKRILVDTKLGPAPSQPVTSPGGCTPCQPFTSPGRTPSQDTAMRVSPLPSPPASEYNSEYSEGKSDRAARSPPKAKGGKRNAVAPGPPYIV